MTARWTIEIEVDPAPKGPIKLAPHHQIHDPKVAREADAVSWGARAITRALGGRVGGPGIADELADRLRRCGVRVQLKQLD